MWFTDVMAVVAVMGILSVSFTASVTVGALLIGSFVKRYFGYLQSDLRLRRFEAEARLEQARHHASIPVWVDREDPMEVAAWNRAVAETWRISARSELGLLGN